MLQRAMYGWDWDEEPNSAVKVGLLVIGSAIRDARLRLGLTQRQLAWRSAMAQSTVSKLERGHLRGMRLRTLARLIGVLRANPNLIYGGEPEPSKRRLPGESRR